MHEKERAAGGSWGYWTLLIYSPWLVLSLRRNLQRAQGQESIPAMIFTPIKDSVTSPSIITPEKISDVSVLQRQKAWSNVPLCLFSTDIFKLSMHSSQREERKEQRPPSQTSHPQEIIPATIFTPVKRPVTSPSIITPEKISNVSFQQRQKVSSNVFMVPDISQLSLHSSEREERKEQRPPSQTCCPQEIIQATVFTPVKHPVTSPSIITPEKISDVSFQQRQKVSSNVFMVPDISQLSLHSSEREERKEQRPPSQTCYPQDKEHTSFIWPDDCEEFTRDFCKWFYTLLNSQHESSGLQEKDWGPQHFMENAVLQLTYMSVKSQYNGGRSASSRLLALVQEDKLSFQPNITSKGLKFERFPKGMVMMMVSGTVFRDNTFLGTFDQVFEVIWNSTSNNWKMQLIVLNIQKSS
ncbi:uncharacterized protein [Phyllobates terribilis]|uniref:uncharacterized protein isoform X2 n=1 Tax=Phyllobates terribilis TaxID=111132 RepID=UPI003CCA7EF3